MTTHYDSIEELMEARKGYDGQKQGRYAGYHVGTRTNPYIQAKEEKKQMNLKESLYEFGNEEAYIEYNIPEEVTEMKEEKIALRMRVKRHLQDNGKLYLGFGIGAIVATATTLVKYTELQVPSDLLAKVKKIKITPKVKVK